MGKTIFITEEQFRKLIEEPINNSDLIEEGLIRSVSYRTVFDTLVRMNIPEKYGIMFRPTKGNPFDTQEAPYKIWFSFNNKLDKMNEKEFYDFIRLLDNLGWNFSDTKTEGVNDLDYNKLKALNLKLMLAFEPKFDVELDINDIPNELYHITRTSLIDRIKKNGLTPKDSIMPPFYKGRLYLFVGLPSEWQNIIKDFKTAKRHSEAYGVFKIDKNKLNQSNKLYLDQNSAYHKACYTLEPIPPHAIELVGVEQGLFE